MKYFSISELCKSLTAQEKGFDNTPDVKQEYNLKRLIEELLDPLREAWGNPIRVTSGFRGFELNKAIGGATTSAHSIGAAADLVPVDGDIKKFKKFVRNWLKTSGIKFDQYIDEKNGSGSEWVHLGLISKSGRQRRQYLMYRNRTYVKLND